MEAIFLVRDLMEMYRSSKKDYHMVFIDLEKTYDRVHRNILWWALVEQGVSSQYIHLIQDMYEGIRTSVPTNGGDTPDFPITIDDVILIDESREGVNEKLELWRETLESKGSDIEDLSYKKMERLTGMSPTVYKQNGQNGEVQQ
ncbi:uncharacterized protein, partial [Rutidosis leptorrhynchoides]|uniref:uncharacterized protein n=1 Tax=Rutidosis leptorrhynchoides TaxID=125765 RepID=UPI003A9997FA